MTVSEAGAETKSSLEAQTILDAMNGPEEIYRALVMGTGDYLRKSGFTKALIGLSGGVDSALTATVAADALGKENVVGITMPSRYSSEGSISDSKKLADNLGLDLWEVPIEPAHQAFTDMLAEQFKGTEANVAEENVQARVRGNVLMTVSNKFGWIVLTTGNKSEMAMGYATLYGDMAGGFAVLKDVPKTTVYELCRWRNRQGVGFGTMDDVIPVAILDKPPSAELREDQLDADSLPAYEVLDPVVEAYVEDDLSYQEMVAQGMDPFVVRQVIAAVDRNEYKRRQAPPGVKITHRAFGKDRRLPIVNRYRQHEGG
jgi:NAD+ synthase (glutamine-hydrolysing)